MRTIHLGFILLLTTGALTTNITIGPQTTPTLPLAEEPIVPPTGLIDTYPALFISSYTASPPNITHKDTPNQAEPDHDQNATPDPFRRDKDLGR